jgi:hypothetical protein
MMECEPPKTRAFISAADKAHQEMAFEVVRLHDIGLAAFQMGNHLVDDPYIQRPPFPHNIN